MYNIIRNSTGKEASVNKILPLISKFINKKHKIIKDIDRIHEYFDDPKFFHFGAILFPVSDKTQEETLSNSVGGYSFFSEDEALLKCIGETLERYSLRTYNKKGFCTSLYKDVKGKALNPETIVNFSPSQKKKKGFEIFNFDDNTLFSWQMGFDLMRGKSIFIPAQLIYLTYKLNSAEKWISLPITTGAAGGSTIQSAIVRGIYEAIEREAFIIYYLNKLPGRKVDMMYVHDTRIKYCADVIRSYNLKLNIFDITTDLGIPTFLSVIIDETGIGPAINLGLKTHMNSYIAILGSIEEALHPRSWIRRKVEENPQLLKNMSYRHINTLEDRALLWYDKRNIKKLSFLLDQPRKKVKLQIKDYSFSEQLDILLKLLKINNINIYYVDVTPRIIKENNYYIVKTILPQLQPFYLIEDFPYHGGTRLYTLPKKLGYFNHETTEKSLNKYPHPFL